MQDPWVSEFMQSTGFGTKLTVPESTPSSTGVKEQRFVQQYMDSIPPPPADKGVPGTIEGPGAYLTGQMPTDKSLSRTPFENPYPKSNILLNKDGTKPLQPTQQRKWQSPGIGNPEISNDKSNYPASQFIPGSAPSGGFKVKEGMEGSDAPKDKNESLKYGSIASAAIAILAGFGFTMNRNNPSREKGFVTVAGITVVAAIVLLVLYLQSGSKSGENLVGYRENGRKLLQKTGFSPPYYPQQRDQADQEIYPNPPVPDDTFEQRLKSQGTDLDRLEGPRGNVGYKRSMPTPDGRAVLPSNKLMRSPGNINMDDATFREYMRRMNGEAPPQVVQSHPYYTFNAEWDHRAQIDDSSRYHGISDEPGQMHRKSIYREPKLQQAGAKRMHLKDPPYGSVQPLSKVHPWMEKDESGTGPAFFASPGEKLIAEMKNAPVQNMLHKPSIEIIEDSAEERSSKQNAADMMKERMALDSRDNVGKPDMEFLKPQEDMSDKKRRMMSKAYQQPQEREEVQINKENAPPRTIKLDKGRILPQEALNIHGTPDESQPVNQTQPTRAEDSEDMFMSAFLEKTTPDQSVIEKAMNSRRE